MAKIKKRKKNNEIMEIKQIEIKLLKFAEYNPRRMDETEMKALEESIKEFGLVEPIVINKDYTIIGGHQRVKAAINLGYIKVPCFIVDLPKDKEKILNLALNRIVGTWEENKLIKMINELNKSTNRDFLKLSGFTNEEINQFLIQYQIEYPETPTIDLNDEELKKIFQRNERVRIGVEKPTIYKKEDKIGFYCDTFEEYETIRENFKTSRRSELDVKKLIKMIKMIK